MSEIQMEKQEHVSLSIHMRHSVPGHSEVNLPVEFSKAAFLNWDSVQL